MRRLKFCIATKAPILISSNAGDPNMTGTMQYISGSSLLGIFANHFSHNGDVKKKYQNNKFYEWFLQGNLKITNAYLLEKQKYGEEKTFFPMPYSIHQDTATKEPDKIVDLLVMDEDKYPEKSKHKTGFGLISSEFIHHRNVQTQLNFHHGRDRKTGVSEDGRIFNYESIKEGQYFSGSIIGKEDILKEFHEHFKDLENIHIGRSKYSQYGKAKISWDTSTLTKEFTNDVEKSQQLDFSQGISLTFLSDVIIYDDNGFSTTDLKYLENSLGVSLKKCFVKTGLIQNYISIWKTRKPSENCFLAGSCFLIEATNEDSQNKLIKWQQTGFGERCNEGFGRIILGWQKNEELTLRKKQQEKKKKPKGDIPKIAKEIMQQIVAKSCMSYCRQKALSDLDDFVRLPESKHLVGKLESWLHDSKNFQFTAKLEQLASKAKKQLENSYNKQHASLSEFIQSRINIGQNIWQDNKLTELKKLMEQAEIKQEDFEYQIYQEYFLTFFSQMRKKIKGAK